LKLKKILERFCSKAIRQQHNPSAITLNGKSPTFIWMKIQSAEKIILALGKRNSTAASIVRDKAEYLDSPPI
jgi:hypothetical protein